MKLNMRESILTTLLLVALLPIAILTFINWQKLSNLKEIEHYNYLQNTIKLMYNTYKQNKNHLETSLNNFSLILKHTNLKIEEKNHLALHQLLLSMKESSNLDILNILDKDFVIIARANSNEYGDNFLIQKFIDKELKNNTFVSIAIIPDKDLLNEGKDLISKTNLTTTLLDKDIINQKIDEEKGIFLYGITPIYKDKNNNNEPEAYIFAAQHLQNKYFKFKENLKKISDIHIGIQSTDFTFIKSRYLLSKTINNINNKPIVNLIAWFNPDERNQELIDIQKTSIFTFVISSILVIILSLLLSKYLVKPIELLDTATKKVSEDDFTVKVDIHGPKEIENLSNAFNKMTASLDEKHQMRETFIATLTHDMRVPLLAEQKALDLIINDDRFKPSKDHQTLIENMSESNKDLLKLVDNLLDTYKLEAGKYKLHKSKQDIIKLINNCINEIKPLADDKNQTIKLITETEGYIISIDKDEIKRVIKNILSNSIKFTPKNGEITVNINKENDNIIFSVADTGIGITEKELKNLFKRYSSGAKKLRKVGTGLGLYLSHCIIEAHEGKIWVKSEINKGSTFFVSLPTNI